MNSQFYAFKFGKRTAVFFNLDNIFVGTSLESYKFCGIT